ncbi:hypothetical protein R1sor_006456 [Riccia sorocarpa]|uniref:Uncharacterized protein n=1 Tax=Riccia sorocarpa TaxID=122646 RepID=A0ABD3HMJ1_9MARC
MIHQDYAVVSYIEDPDKFREVMGGGRKTKVGGKCMSKAKAFNIMESHLRNVGGFPEVTGEEMKKRFDWYNEGSGGRTDINLVDLDYGSEDDDMLAEQHEPFMNSSTDSVQDESLHQTVEEEEDDDNLVECERQDPTKPQMNGAEECGKRRRRNAKDSRDYPTTNGRPGNVHSAKGARSRDSRVSKSQGVLRPGGGFGAEVLTDHLSNPSMVLEVADEEEKQPNVTNLNDNVNGLSNESGDLSSDEDSEDTEDSIS